ncbi:MAG: TldD/PmbA family protein [Gemmatimonadales bacterium]
MIIPLLEQAARRTDQADLAWKTDETTTLSFIAGRPAFAMTSQGQGINLRVLVEGRQGVAGTSSDVPGNLLDLAVDAARAGDAITLLLPPGSAPLPSVVTHSPRAATATIADLGAIATLLRDRLAGERAEVNIIVERTLGSVHVANTDGLNAGYDISRVTVAIECSRLRDGRLITVPGHLSNADLPTLGEIEQLVATMRQRLLWAERDAEVAVGRQTVGFLPESASALLIPVEQALMGKATLHSSSPLARRRGSRTFSESFTLHDDPLAAGRPGSRPVDDEGVPSQRLALVEQGSIEGFIYDLETASRVGVPPTGHGRRATFGKPHAAFSNLVVAPGEGSWTELLVALGDGLLVQTLRGDGQGNVSGGAFARVASLAWRVQGGEVIGLVPEITVAGNAHDLLGRIVALGRDVEWVGSRATPTIVVDGASVF